MNVKDLPYHRHYTVSIALFSLILALIFAIPAAFAFSALCLATGLGIILSVQLRQQQLIVKTAGRLQSLTRLTQPPPPSTPDICAQLRHGTDSIEEIFVSQTMQSFYLKERNREAQSSRLSHALIDIETVIKREFEIALRETMEESAALSEAANRMYDAAYNASYFCDQQTVLIRDFSNELQNSLARIEDLKRDLGDINQALIAHFNCRAAQSAGEETSEADKVQTFSSATLPENGGKTGLPDTNDQQDSMFIEPILSDILALENITNEHFRRLESCCQQAFSALENADDMSTLLQTGKSLAELVSMNLLNIQDRICHLGERTLATMPDLSSLLDLTDRRRMPRYMFDLDCHIQSDTYHGPARLADISIGGAKISVPAETLQQNGAIQLSIGKNPKINLTGKIVITWSEGYCVQFQDDEDTRHRVTEFIHENLFEQIKKDKVELAVNMQKEEATLEEASSGLTN